MKIKTDQFCGLATSPSFQTWLYNNDVELYRSFISGLQQSRGCSQNRELMLELLTEIQNRGNSDSLAVFISKNYPHMIDGNESMRSSYDDDTVFSNYNPNILTYPRRMIVEGDERSLNRQAREFLLDKMKGDYIIVGNKLYIEYLEKKDKSIANSIPLSNWQIANYRQEQSGGEK